MKPKKTIAIMIGTRPEAIKMLPIYLAMKADARVEVILVLTAQHRELLDQVLSIFNVSADVDLNLMSHNQTLSEISAKIITGVQKVLADIKPDIVLVHGDTTTCLYSALAAFYENIPIGHVEAGLRTYDFKAPWPEEMNRRLVDTISQWCFAPTIGAANNLKSEGIDDKRIFITGNTIVDALLLAREKIANQKISIPSLPAEIFDNHRIILVTGHRRESFGEQFEQICGALLDIVNSYLDTVLIYPVHLNPNVQKPVNQILGSQERVYLIEPVGYLEFIYLMDASYLIITDSGGIQEEAPTLNRPVLVTRNKTERPEAVDAGLAKLIGTSREKIVSETAVLLNDRDAYRKMSQGQNPFGDGNASKSIIEILCSSF